MATLTWIGNAHDVKQIGTITVANTWAAGDTATCTINGKDLVITCGSTTTTTATVAAAIKEAWMSSTRLDGTSSSSNATSNFGGQEFGEFSEITASVSGSVVTLVANEAGVPFTLSVTEATAGTGTATGATSTSATGKQFWNNADNWDTGSVPVDDDIVVFRDSNVPCRYGLPNSTDLEVTMQVWMSYTGEIGLPVINETTPGKPYVEYRQRYVRLDDGGTGTDIAHRFGLGKDGTGPTLVNLKHITVKCSPIVYNTGTPKVSRVGTKALNICCTANTSTLNVVNGSVDWSSQDGSTAAFVTVKQSGGDSRGVNGLKASSAVTLHGGTMLIGSSLAISTIDVKGGALRIENQTATISSLQIYVGANVDMASGYSAASLTVSALSNFGGTLDARNSGGFTITNAGFYRGSKVLDPSSAITIASNGYIYFDTPDFQLGNSETSTRLKMV